MVRRARGYKELHRDGLRSGCAFGIGVVALVGFQHPHTTTTLPEGTGTGGKPLPEAAVAARNDFSRNGYGGACPPEGDEPHRYVFTVYAMPQEKLPIDETASAAMVGFFANTSALGRASITTLYGR
jgi:hypothetical protein